MATPFPRESLAYSMRCRVIIDLLSFAVAAQQIVGRERNQRACHRQLARNAVVSRRVNSTVRRLHGATRNFRGKHHRDAAPYLRTPLLREDHPRQGARARASSATLMPRRVDRAAVWN